MGKKETILIGVASSVHINLLSIIFLQVLFFICIGVARRHSVFNFQARGGMLSLLPTLNLVLKPLVTK